MLNPEIKEKWLTKLRSGEYKQGFGALRNYKNQFCCLGVLCDLYQKETGKGEWKITPCDPNQYLFDGEQAILPDSVANWAGINDSPGVVPNSPEIKNRYGYERVPLWFINDVAAKDFNEIADIIEVSNFKHADD